MPALDQNAKSTCGDCGTSVTKYNLSRHKARCSGGALFCANVPISLLTQEMYYIIILPNNTVQQDPKLVTRVKNVTQKFVAFMLYVNTKTLNMENKLGSERAILMWRT